MAYLNTYIIEIYIVGIGFTCNTNVTLILIVLNSGFAWGYNRTDQDLDGISNDLSIQVYTFKCLTPIKAHFKSSTLLSSWVSIPPLFALLFSAVSALHI